MATHPQLPDRTAFGPFEVNAEAGELRKSGICIRLSGQPLRILLVLLAHAGELVTREQLREEVWGGTTFVDFEHGLNAAMNKLRRVLNDSADKPRYIETVPGRGYRFIGMLERRDAARVPGIEGSLNPEELTVRRRGVPWWWLSAMAVSLISFAVWWRLHDSVRPLPPWKLTRITNDPGLSDTAALSPDGKIVAYSSDRGQEGERDLYVQQVAGGQPIRLTFDGAGNTTPDFSPDGSRIVFRSSRDGGGIYEISAFGGEVRLLARDGLNPRFSPDGSRVAYWVGGESIAIAVPGGGAVWIVSVTGGPAARVGRNLTNARYPIWSPDGRNLLVLGYNSWKAYDVSPVDWWLVPVNGAEAIKTGAYDRLTRAGVQERDQAVSRARTIPIPNVPRPVCWIAADNNVIFSAPAQNGDTHNLWQAGISPSSGELSGAFTRLTTGAGNEVTPSCASADALAFTDLRTGRAIWSLSADLTRGAPKGGLQRMTPGSGIQGPSLSSDGRYVAFSSAQSGRFSIWLRDLISGKESHVAPSPFVQRFPTISPSGSRIAFSSYEANKRFIYVSSPGAAPEKLCEECLRATDWSRGEKSLLTFGGSPYQISVLDLASHRQTLLFQHPAYNLLYGRFSPDNSWVSFTVRIRPNRGRIVIAPIGGQKPIPEKLWIEITEEGAEDWAGWAPDGKTLYFTSARDGHTCLWGQRIDAISHRPKGEAFVMQHFHGRAFYPQGGGWSATGGRIAVALSEDTGNIWLMSRSAGR